jgi:hypothetical protein
MNLFLLDIENSFPGLLFLKFVESGRVMLHGRKAHAGHLGCGVFQQWESTTIGGGCD